MPLYRPSELKKQLAEENLRPKKRYSQNFLIDGNILKKITEAAEIQPGDLVIEIGPGPGALTEALLNKGAHVIAVEKDGAYVQTLRERVGNSQALTVIHIDALKVDWEKLLQGRKAKVVANLPYHLTTPLLTQLVTLESLFERLVLMVQWEFAQRCVAVSKTPEYSSLTLFLKLYAKTQIVCKVSRKSFFPAPKVDSAVLLLFPQKPSIAHPEKVTELVRHAFQKRRKMLRSSLSDLFTQEQLQKAFAACGIRPEARPEELELEAFVALQDSLSESSP